VPSAEIYRIYLLRPGARPRKHDPLTFREVGIHRQMNCHCYSDCLQFAARIPWQGFSCDRCPLAEIRPARLRTV
jgi:hypothetical protein